MAGPSNADLQDAVRKLDASRASQILEGMKASGQDPFAAVRACDEEGQTLLHHCAEVLNVGDNRGRGLQMVSTLVQYGIDVNVGNSYGEPPLTIAVRRVAAAQPGPSSGARPPRLAAVQRLLEARAEADAADSIAGETPLMEAAMQGDLALCRLLLAFRADPARRSRSDRVARNFAEDLAPPRPDLLELLDPERTAVLSPEPALAPEPLAAEPPRSPAPSSREAPTRAGSESHDFSSDGEGVEVDAAVAELSVALRKAAEAADVTRLESLLAEFKEDAVAEADVDDVESSFLSSAMVQRDSCGHSLLHSCVQASASSDSTDDDAVDALRARGLRALFAAGMVGINSKNCLGETPFAMAIRNALTRSLLKSKDGPAPEGVLRTLLEARAEPDTADKPHFETPLMEAASAGNMQICQLLLEFRADPERRSYHGLTALSFADDPAVRQILEDHRAELVAAAAVHKEAKTPQAYDNPVKEAFRAVRSMDAGALHVVLDSPARDLVLLAQSEGQSLLHAASQLRPTVLDAPQVQVMVRLLILKAADITCRDVLGETPLATAVHKAIGVRSEAAMPESVDESRLYVVRALLDASADTNTADTLNGETPLMEAACEHDESLCQLLLSSKADPRQRNSSGMVALDFADEEDLEIQALLFERVDALGGDLPEEDPDELEDRFEVIRQKAQRAVNARKEAARREAERLGMVAALNEVERPEEARSNREHQEAASQEAESREAAQQEETRLREAREREARREEEEVQRMEAANALQKRRESERRQAQRREAERSMESRQEDYRSKSGGSGGGSAPRSEGSGAGRRGPRSGSRPRLREQQKPAEDRREAERKEAERMEAERREKERLEAERKREEEAKEAAAARSGAAARQEAERKEASDSIPPEFKEAMSDPQPRNVRQMLKAVKDPLSITRASNRERCFLLHLCVQAPPTDKVFATVALLLQYKAEVDARNVLGETPLHLATRTALDHIDLNREASWLRPVRKLLEARADPEATDLLGETAIMEAACAGAKEVCLILLEARASPVTQSQCGLSAINAAMMEGHDEVVKLLTDFAPASFKKPDPHAVDGATADAEADARPEPKQKLPSEPMMLKVHVVGTSEVMEIRVHPGSTVGDLRPEVRNRLSLGAEAPMPLRTESGAEPLADEAFLGAWPELFAGDGVVEPPAQEEPQPAPGAEPVEPRVEPSVEEQPTAGNRPCGEAEKAVESLQEPPVQPQQQQQPEEQEPAAKEAPAPEAVPEATPGVTEMPEAPKPEREPELAPEAPPEKVPEPEAEGGSFCTRVGWWEDLPEMPEEPEQPSPVKEVPVDLSLATVASGGTGGSPLLPGEAEFLEAGTGGDVDPDKQRKLLQDACKKCGVAVEWCSELDTLRALYRTSRQMDSASVRDLKQECMRRKVPFEGVMEKEELKKRARQALVWYTMPERTLEAECRTRGLPPKVGSGSPASKTSRVEQLIQLVFGHRPTEVPPEPPKAKPSPGVKSASSRSSVSQPPQRRSPAAPTDVRSKSPPATAKYGYGGGGYGVGSYGGYGGPGVHGAAWGGAGSPWGAPQAPPQAPPRREAFPSNRQSTFTSAGAAKPKPRPKSVRPKAPPKEPEPDDDRGFGTPDTSQYGPRVKRAMRKFPTYMGDMPDDPQEAEELWTDQDLHNFFFSSGFIRPKKKNVKPKITKAMIDAHYKTLGVKSGEKLAVVRATYRQLALKYHPDKNEDSRSATQKMQEIAEAYGVICKYLESAEADKKPA